MILAKTLTYCRDHIEDNITSSVQATYIIGRTLALNRQLLTMANSRTLANAVV